MKTEIIEIIKVMGPPYESVLRVRLNTGQIIQIDHYGYSEYLKEGKMEGVLIGIGLIEPYDGTNNPRVICSSAPPDKYPYQILDIIGILKKISKTSVEIESTIYVRMEHKNMNVVVNDYGLKLGDWVHLSRPAGLVFKTVFDDKNSSP